MSKSSHEGFNALCDSIITNQEITYAAHVPDSNIQRSDYDKLVRTIATLTRRLVIGPLHRKVHPL